MFIATIIAMPVAILLYCLFISRSRSFPFWKLAAEIPDQAYEWFQNDACWFIYDPTSGKNKQPDLGKYQVGFYLYVPSLGRTIKIYADFHLIEESQKDFIEKYSNSIF